MKRPPSAMPVPELSRPFVLTRLSEAGETFRFEADSRERKALAERFDLIDLPSLEAEGRIAAFDHGRGVRVEGRLKAEVVQACVVTLEPVPAHIEEAFARIYTANPAVTSEEETVVDLDEDDPPEPITGGAVDVGEAVAETLGLALDPYPRAPGAVLPAVPDEAAKSPPDVTKPREKRRESPFSALKGLVKKP